MELNIGTNIKRLRLEKGLTQEQLADLLSVSTAAVSKWEAKNTYPDITLLFPLAEILCVSVDELLGYDEAKAKKEVQKLIEEYHERHRKGRFAEASALLADARKMYPHDYRVMHAYMWDKAGGDAGNRADVLLKNRNEFMQICDCILDSCTEENLRLDALNMKAKLLHAQNDTEGALALLSQLPTWWGGAEQKKEQLFARGTPEYCYWNRRNCYALMDAMANKLARSVWFDASLSPNEKMERVEAMGDAFSALCQKKGMEALCIAAHMLYAELAGKLSADGAISDIIRLREKQFSAMEKMMTRAETDEVLRECIERTYKTGDILRWQIEWLLHSEHPQFSRLRSDPAYMKMLTNWKR